ncbi:DUF881 domain-containing protein [Heliobacterium chlorum]|uniref:DUF881 domain-containing protein n=1 Tax=Heliobacterium chlorum TaxID=2698 RepID=A0ABR7T4R0_HELCL|nr:DUF881 domain-containing protein [Heliobacterium chlorum]MBC9785765.1 DUF881 domain-containing protein [Heliobacterium chlorum]
MNMNMKMRMKWKKWQVAATIVALTLGILLVTQFNTATVIAQGRSQVQDRIKSLENILERSNEEQESKEKEVALLKAELDKYEKVAKGDVGSGLSDEIDRLRIMTGYYPVAGPGIQVTLDDHLVPNAPLDILDLMDIVNILRYAGAEAIAVNGQRIVANSEIYVSGRNTLINKTPVSSDREHIFIIDAIGPADELSRVLQVTDGKIISLRESKIDVKIVKQNKIVIPAYTDTQKFRFAKPLPDKPTESRALRNSNGVGAKGSATGTTTGPAPGEKAVSTHGVNESRPVSESKP